MTGKLATILNVNDHEQTRYLVTRMLRGAGYEVLEAATGEDALRLAQTLPDLIILDVKLPDISGFQVCRMLKAHEDTSSILILHTSATFVTADKKIEGLEGGADGYLSHPFEPAELIATVRSLLRLRHAEQELRQRADDLVQANKRKDEFLAMLAHELRNPLAGIATATPLLSHYRDDAPRFTQLQGVIGRQVRHLSRLIDGLLDVSRVTQGKIGLEREPIDVTAPLLEALQVHASMLDKRAQRVSFTPPAAPLVIDGDGSRLQQVFSNLIDNASKYSEHGAPIVIECEVAEDRGRRFAVVRVRDSGIGIAQTVLPHVFELFVQADESLERTRGGMGIGLTLVKRLVEMHGGEVAARSDGVGRGAEFEVRLPLTRTTTSNPAPAPAPPIAAERRVRSVLIVEDNVDARDMLKALLELSGFAVEVAADGPSGVQRALAGNFDLAIVDVGLPGMDGYSVARTLRAAPVGPSLRLIALTGYGGDDPRRQASAAGFDRYLVKPVDPDRLIRTIEEIGRA
jgi:signal transduction histidine kinase